MPDSPAVLADVARAYPFPIAFALREAVLDAPDDERRVRGIVKTFTLGIQYAALVCVGEYARADYKDPRLSASLEGLRVPKVSDFGKLVHTALDSFASHGVAPLVAELADFRAALAGGRVRVPDPTDGTAAEKPLPVLQALERLRNALAHEGFEFDWPRLAERYSPLLTEFLGALGWTARYPLLRLLDGGRLVRLMGCATSFADEPLPDAALPELGRAQAEGRLSGLLLADAGLTRFLSLYPLVVMEACDACRAGPLRGLTEEVFLFNGVKGARRVVYLGARHSWPGPAPHAAAVDELYARKDTPPPLIDVAQVKGPELGQRARRQAAACLAAERQARRYLPELYQARPEMDAALRAFLGGRRVGFCLLGESGLGKTSLLCRKVEEWGGHRPDAAEPARAAVLFYEGGSLSTQGPLEQRVMNDLNLTGDFPRLLNKMREDDARLILVIDAVNDDPAPHAALKALCEFVRRHAEAPVKVVFSFRTAFFERTLEALGRRGADGEVPGLFRLDAFQTREALRQGRREETYRFELLPMTAEEAGTLYESYRGTPGFRPLTPFADLSPTVKRQLPQPWFLRMVVETFDGRAVPAELWPRELLEAYACARVYGRDADEAWAFRERAAFVDGLVRLMRQQKAAEVWADEPALSPALAQALREQRLGSSEYLRLLDEGILTETRLTETSGYRPRVRYRVGFVLDRLFEYLLSEDVLREAGGWDGSSGERLAALLEEGKEFKHLTAAVELLLTRAAQDGRFALLTDTLRAAEQWLAEPVIVRVLLALEEMRHANFEPLLDALAGPDAGEKELTVFINTSYHLNELRRFGPTVACLKRGEAVGRRLVQVEGRAELANDLATSLMNKGNALQGLGRLGEAVACYDESIVVYRRLVHEEGRAELAEDLAIALLNKALLLEKQERWADALAHYAEVVHLREACVRAGMSHLLPVLLRTIRYRLMTFLDLRRWAEASADVIRALEHAAPVLQTDSPPEGVLKEAAALIARLRRLAPEEREQVLVGLGEWRPVVEGWLAG
jgi:tetratricopeptide (TPR) repeat protein